MKYQLYIKDHGEGYGDYEDECEAISRLQATRIFLKRINKSFYAGEEEGFISADWGEKELYAFVEEVMSDEEMHRKLTNYEKEMMH